MIPAAYLPLAKILALACAVAGLVAYGYQWGARSVRKDWALDTAIRNAESSRLHVDHLKALASRDAAIDKIKSNLEKRHVADTQKIAKALADSRRLFDSFGGLRDPGARADCPAVPGAAIPAANSDHGAGGARLSREAGEFLLALAADADTVVAQLDQCRAWALSMDEAQRESLKK